VLLVTGAKDTGKTSLLVRLIRHLANPRRVILALKSATSVVAEHTPGTDTWHFAKAGADAIGLTWPEGSYTAAFPGEAKSLDRQLTLEELVAASLQLIRARRGKAAAPLVLAEGFSSTSYPRIHVLPAPGRRDRTPEGPVLAVWSLRSPPGSDRDIARSIETNLAVIAGWAAEVSRDLASGDRVPRPGGSTVAAALLAGGKGTRLGGVDKWAIDIAGQRQSDRMLTTLAGLFHRILIIGRAPEPLPAGVPVSGGGPGPRAASSGGPVNPPVEWHDDLVAGSGPLGGIHAALSAAREIPVFALAQDMPFVSPALIRHMLFRAATCAEAFDVILPRWGGFAEPLHAIYGPRVLGRLTNILSAEKKLSGRRVTAALEGLDVKEIPEAEVRLFGEPEVLFFNLNTPADVMAARAIAAGNGPEGGCPAGSPAPGDDRGPGV